MPIAAQFLRCRRRSLWLQRCVFWAVESFFSLTTAAQNILVFLRKSPLHKNHFFEWWKTENPSNACGTVTLKSPLSRGSDAPHVHQRLRKRLSRCTLDCGFKTSESPALRGFVGGPRALATAVLYLVLLSNGFPYSKIRLKKFGFSSKSVPANIVQKLSAYSLLKSDFFRILTSLTNAPSSFSWVKMGTHSAPPEKSHTPPHTPKHGGQFFPVSASTHYCPAVVISSPPERRLNLFWKMSFFLYLTKTFPCDNLKKQNELSDRMKSSEETAHSTAPKGNAKALRQKDRTRTALRKAQSLVCAPKVQPV